MTASPLSPQAVADVVGPALGAGVLDGTAELTPIAVPGVRDTVSWLVRDGHLDHPLQAYVGRWPDGEVRVLSDNQDAWAALMAVVRPQITDTATALGYVRQFLELTRGPSVTVQEVSGPDDMPWRPGSAAEEQRRVDLATTAFAEPIVTAVDDGFHLELTLVVGQRLQRNLFDVTADGRIASSFQVIADDLPLPVIR